MTILAVFTVLVDVVTAFFVLITVTVVVVVVLFRPLLPDFLGQHEQLVNLLLRERLQDSEGTASLVVVNGVVVVELLGGRLAHTLAWKPCSAWGRSDKA